MKVRILDLIDFKKVDALLEGFNTSTGFVTAILDLEGKVLSRSGWRPICTEFHRASPETSERCTLSDTILAGKLATGEKYHYYKCLNGLIDVAVPLIINGEHIANLFSGQFFFEKPDLALFKKQAETFGFDPEKYLDALEKVPVVQEEKVKSVMSFLLNMTQLIVEMTIQRIEQKEKDKTIRESEEKFRSIFETANVGKSITLTTGEINVNEAFCKMLGFSREELQNKKWQDITPKEEIPIIQKYLDNLVKGDIQSARFEKSYICKNGDPIWTDVSVTLRIDDKGKPLYFITTVFDITERKRAEKNLVESEKRYRTLFENMTSGFVLFEVVQNDKSLPVDLIIVDANRRFEATTGLKLKDAIGKRLTQVLPGIEDDSADWIGKYSKVALTGEPIQFEQGSELLDIYYSVAAFQSGPKQCAVTFIDITERKRAEVALAESEERFRKIFEEGPLGMVMASLNTGKFYRANKAFCHMLGYTEEELLQRTFLEVTYVNDLEKDLAAVKNLSEGRIQKYNTEKRYLKKDGSIIWAALALSRIYSEKNQSYYALAMIEDITKRKMAEEEIHKLNAELEIKVDERTAQLKAANKDLETFTYSVSHDLKAPLRGIDGYSKLLLDKFKPALNAEAQKFIETIRRSTRQMNQLIDDLLSYSRLERSEINLQRIKISELIKSVVNNYSADLEDAKFKVNINCPDIEIMADARGLTIAIRNVIENAIKFTRGTANPLIQIEVEDKDLLWIVSVQDNGIGFDMKYHDKIFEIFQRLQRVEDFPGTGIGLAMVSKAMNKMNGQVRATSSLGEGSTFFLEIPKNQFYPV